VGGQIGQTRHYPGMAQKSPDEARRPPGTGPFCQPQPAMTPNHQNVEMLGTDDFNGFMFWKKDFNHEICETYERNQKSFAYFVWFVVKNSDACPHSARVWSLQALAVAGCCWIERADRGIIPAWRDSQPHEQSKKKHDRGSGNIHQYPFAAKRRLYFAH
jgi:hypothetical protein